MKRMLRKWAPWGVLLAVPVVFLGVDLAMHSRVRPPAGVKTLGDFIAWNGDVGACFVHHRAGHDFLETWGRMPGLLPSGPSAYVFDESGKMVDWSSDSGDDSRFQSKWRTPVKPDRITREEALKRFSGLAATGTP